ncbi:MAG: 16S rRNA methyltransferase [Candidatus Thorarchaeota archaeon]|nr:MAG: 16S rRNA methyltransferase [Candidatus Thorarchaeota archaeon]
MMHLVLADSELELIPEKIAGHPSVRGYRSRILDSSLHHNAMKSLEDGYRRGRPDIVHISLLVAMESILNREGMLRVYVHTRGDTVIYINPETRMIKNYGRFKGLMQQLLERGRVPSNGEALMEARNETLAQLLEKLDGRKILFSPEGKRSSMEEIMEEDVVCIIGGFPHGDFLSPVYDMADEVVSIYHEMLPAWTVVMEAIVSYENKFIFRQP